jgi:hypothetical protein
MASIAVTPVAPYLPTTEADISGTTVPSNEDWAVDIELSNQSGSTGTARVGITDGTTIAWLQPDKSMAQGDAIIVGRGILLPTGWRVRGRCGVASTVQVIVTAVKRSTL